MSMSGTKQYLHEAPYGFNRLVPLLAVLAALLLGYVITAFQTELHEVGSLEVFSRLMWHNATVRPPILLVLIVAGWAVVVRICRDSGLDISLVLGGRLQPTLATWHAALLFTCIVLAAHLIHFIASETPGLTWRPWLTCNLALHAALAVLGLLPAQVFQHESRFSLLKTLWDSVIAPCAPVTFWHVIVADYLTSLAKALSDLQLSACISTAILSEHAPARGETYTPTTALWEAHYFSCIDTYANALMLALPFWWRLMQCLKVYSVTRESKNLWNALKYSTAFPLVYSGYLRRHRPSHHHDKLFVLCAIIQSGYCFIWDVQMDWGLLKRNPRSPFGWSLRSELLITKSKPLYLLLCIFNLGLRFIWALSLFGVATSPGGGMFFLEAVEIIRRTVWAIFRIEWEYIVKVLPQERYSQVPLTMAGATPDSMSEGSDIEMKTGED